MGFRLRQRGDTIVEVLIAIAIVSSVMGISYSIVNSNILTLQDNQERIYASKIAQSQIEKMRIAWADFPSGDADNFPAGLNDVSDGFCFDTAVSTPSAVIIPKLPPNINDPYPPAFDTRCIADGNYRITIERNSVLNNFIVKIRWDGSNGIKNQILMAYKLRIN